MYICTEEQYELSRDFTGSFFILLFFLVQTCLLLFPCYIPGLVKLLARKVMIRMGNGNRWFPNGGYF
jgi:hypothetical protein